MSVLADEILSYLGSAEMDDEEFLEHYGTPRHSGRYPWGSGEDPYQHTNDFLGRVEELKKSGWAETPENIKNTFGLTTTQYRTEKALATAERRALVVDRAKSLREDGLGYTEIGRQMGGVRESTVRSWLNSESENNMRKAQETADFLKKQVDKYGMVDIGNGVPQELNISKEKLAQAVYILQRDGYVQYGGRVPQVTNPGQQTTLKVLCKPGTEHKEIYDYDKIHSINEYISRDGGDTYEKKFTYPASLDSKRLKVRYAEDGGVQKDGVIELRRNVSDLSLGESRYSQVRIMVDGTHYLKGMAVYGDDKDFPPGVDVIFNTNKHKGTPACGPDGNTVLKKIKNDPDNPFGSAIKDANLGGQYWYDSKTGEHISGSSDNPNKKLGLINKRADEGDWTEWKDALPSQFLSKQSKAMAEKQLGIAKANKMEEYAEICALQNPTVKKYYLHKFAESCDSAAIHLQAAALPGQKYHVILPMTSMGDTEVYAPNYADGTKLALVRFPHGGTFEIPILTVNNRNREGIRVIGKDAGDAIGINSKVAERLSGADFDGDTVMCIPTHDKAGKVKITSTPPLQGLVGFDNKAVYGATETSVDANGKKHYYRNGNEYRVMSEHTKQLEMGKISNLITDMTLYGAKPEDMEKAVRHSMVIIDAEKHKLDYKASERDNDIAYLKKKYRGEGGGGASTIVSKAKGEYDVPKRQGSPRYNIKGKDWYDPSRPEGALVWKTADDVNYTVKKTNKRTGEVTEVTKQHMQKSTNMAETDDAYTLVSKRRHPMELVYADYANSMKSLANEARKLEMSTGKIEYNKDAKAKYRAEYDSLMDKLNTAEKNAIRERSANLKAAATVKEKQAAAKTAGSELSKKDVKKAGQQALTKYRQEVGSVSRRDRNIQITDKEWEAIQAGAVSETILKRILNNCDADSLRERAMPKTSKEINQAKQAQIKALSSSYTIAQIADKLGISTSTVSKYLKGAA